MAREHEPPGPSASRSENLDTEHTLKNHLAVILGYCELLLMELPEADPRHANIVDMQRTANTAIATLEGETR